MQPFYEILPHTGDMRIRVRGKDWEDLLREAAHALYDIITGWTPVSSGPVEHTLELEAGDREELLVAWLGELLYWFEVREVLFGGFHFERLDPRGLRVRLRGERFEADKHVIKTEIKAVTHHEVLVREGEGGWEACVIFDL